MRCGIIGLANTGKTTIFNCISSHKAPAGDFNTNKLNIGTVNVPDSRLYELEKFVPTQKIIHATVEITDIPGLSKSSGTGDSSQNKFLGEIRNTDALIHVLRCFDNNTIPHIEGSIDPMRDKEIVDFELQVKDIESITKKIIKLEKLVKIGDKDAVKAIEILNIYKNHIENFKPARTAPVNDSDKKYIDDIFLLTQKPVMYVCNVDDNSAVSGNKYSEAFFNGMKKEQSENSNQNNSEILIISGKLESEIAEFESIDDRIAFLKDAGLNEPSVNKLIESAYKLLNLMSFLTVGPKEIRAWTIKKDSTAPEAAGAIHSDLEKGFIRAEVIKYVDFMKYGSEHACKENGKLHVEGKKYIVQDGDLLNIRFNV